MLEQEPLEPPVRRRAAISRVARLAMVLSLLFAFGVGGWLAGGQPWTDGASNSAASTTNSDTATLTSATTLTSAQVDELSVADVAEQVGPAVVTITNLQDLPSRFGDDDDSGQLQEVSKGSGYIIDDQGHVVTNNHVIAGAAALEVQFADGTTVEATVVGSDPFQDVAVLQLDLSDGTTVPGTVPFGDSSAVRVGDEVVAIGSAFGELTNTVTDGTVNAVDRSLDTGFGYLMEHLIQHDADIWPGNSGGPLLNLQGEVIGMNVAKATTGPVSDPTSDGIGFAIDSNAVKAIVDEIIATGKATHPYLGIRGEPFGDGHAVSEVTVDGPAADAGLQAGDVITAIDDQQIDERHPFLNLLFEYSPGDQVTLTVDRDGDTVTVDVVLGERPAEES